MKLYPKGSWGLLSQLINESNPGLTVELTEDNALVLEKPNGTNLGSSERNTRIRINGSAGSGVQGKAELFYDRISLSVVFRYPVTITASPTVKKLSDLIPDLNEFLGITLVKEDLAEPDKVPGYGYEETVLDVGISPDSFCYRGKIQVLWSRRSAGIYPDSGPGTKVLRVGDLTEGYFGVVPGSEMVGVGEIYREVVYGTNLIPKPETGFNWLKFALDGDFYFFPMKALFTATSWNDVKEMEGISGERTEPLICKHPEKTYYFVPSLPTIGKEDPTLLDKKDPTTTAARIFDKLHKSVNGTGLWDNRTDINSSEPFWWKNTKATADEIKPAFYTDITRNNDTEAAKTNKNNWRPLLRIVNPDDYRSRLRNIGGILVGKLIAPALSIDASARDENMLVRLADIQYRYAVSISAPVVKIGGSTIISAIKDFKSMTLGGNVVGKPPVLHLTVEPIKPPVPRYNRTNKSMVNHLTIEHVTPLVVAINSIHGPTISSSESIFRTATDLSLTDGELGLFD